MGCLLGTGFDNINGEAYNTIGSGSSKEKKYSYLKKLVQFAEYQYSGGAHNLSVHNTAGLSKSIMGKAMIYTGSGGSNNDKKSFDPKNGCAMQIDLDGGELYNNTGIKMLSVLTGSIELAQKNNKLYVRNVGDSINYTSWINQTDQYNLVWYIEHVNNKDYNNKLFIKSQSNNKYYKILDKEINFENNFDIIKGVRLGADKIRESLENKYNGYLKLQKLYRLY